MITEDYVSFETAKLLKEKGFDENCSRSYVKDKLAVSQGFNNSYYATMYSDDSYRPISAPTLQMAMKWLREKWGVQIEITIVGTNTWESPTKWMYGFRCQTKDVIDRGNTDFSSYEEACEAAIKYCLENLI